MAAFDMKIIYTQHHQLTPEIEQKLNAKFVSMEELIKQSDVLTLHAPLTPETKHILGTEQFKQMKNSAYLINASRGPVIDEGALLTALQNHELAGAALDVYEKEVGVFNSDLSDQEFSDEVLDKVIKSPRFILTPHIAFYTTKAVKNMATVSLNAMVSELKTGASEKEIDLGK